MGRPKGSLNRTNQQQAFVLKVERFLRQSAPNDYPESDALARATVRLFNSTSDDKVKANLLIHLTKYKHGLPVQPIEHSGEIGLADRIKRIRERAMKGAESAL